MNVKRSDCFCHLLTTLPATSPLVHQGHRSSDSFEHPSGIHKQLDHDCYCNCCGSKFGCCSVKPSSKPKSIRKARDLCQLLTISRVWILRNVGAGHVEWQFIWLIYYVHGRYEREATLNWSIWSMFVYLGRGRQQRERRQQWQRRLRASMISSVPTAVKRQSSQIWKTLPLYRGNQLRYTTPHCNQSLRPMNQGEAGLLHGFCYGQL